MSHFDIDNTNGLEGRVYDYFRKSIVVSVLLIVLVAVVAYLVLQSQLDSGLDRAFLLWVFLGMILLATALALAFLIPVTKKMRLLTRHFIEENEQANSMVTELAGLYETLDKSHKALSQVKFALDRSTVYARLNPDGKIKSVDQKFADVLGQKQVAIKGLITEVLNAEGFGADFLQQLIEVTASGQIWRGEINGKRKDGQKFWLESGFVPVMHERKVQEILFTSLDITERKHLEDTLNRKSREKFESKINEQKMRSILILEGQEEERRRIAMDIHDGIGQILTGLKFKVESIDPEHQGKAIVRLAEARILLQDLIQEVRRVTFDLTPNNLTDYGLKSALKSYANEIQRMSEIAVVLDDQSAEDLDLEKALETNLYRIVQEAVNNALKYAAATKILITLSDNGYYLNISVEDNGKGFDIGEVSTNEVFMHSGNGLLNMKARASLHNGRFHISSKPGEGTRININIPLKL